MHMKVHQNLLSDTNHRPYGSLEGFKLFKPGTIDQSRSRTNGRFSGISVH